jgi:hypothetical protein
VSFSKYRFGVNTPIQSKFGFLTNKAFETIICHLFPLGEGGDINIFVFAKNYSQYILKIAL